jgi:tRNA threonylcarbamoyladenosine biosynthesis protein TsaE
LNFEFDISNAEDLAIAAKKMLQFSGDLKIFAFQGEMGVGKTTFIKELCKALGSKDNFGSPTYSIVNEYSSRAGKIFHFDLYRIKNKEELLDIGFEEYLSSGSYCFIEWPEIANEFFSQDVIRVEIYVSDNKRHIASEKGK